MQVKLGRCNTKPDMVKITLLHLPRIDCFLRNYAPIKTQNEKVDTSSTVDDVLCWIYICVGGIHKHRLIFDRNQ